MSIDFVHRDIGFRAVSFLIGPAFADESIVLLCLYPSYEEVVSSSRQ
jgi:hypothetical protein